MKYKRGLIIGFIVGILCVPLVLLGLSSPIGLLFYPLIIVPRMILLFLFGESVLGLVFISIIFYSLIGFLVDYLYGKVKKK